MQKYDVVLLLDVALSDNERKAVLDEIEKSLGKGILEKDDIGLMSLKHQLNDKPGQDKAYFTSYLVECPAQEMIDFKKALVYNKALKRYVVYKLGVKDQFFHFADLNKELTAIIEGWDVKKLGQKLIFFTDSRNAKYITWKAVEMLKKYITRFGSIKPRKYTGNSVSTQKKLRDAVLRARELGLIEFIRK